MKREDGEDEDGQADEEVDHSEGFEFGEGGRIFFLESFTSAHGGDADHDDEQYDERQFCDESWHCGKDAPVGCNQIESGDDEQSEADVSHANEDHGVAHKLAAFGWFEFGGGDTEEDVSEAGAYGHSDADEMK